MKREELEKAYNQYIEELAKDAIAKRPVNHNLLNIIYKVQSDIRDLDIIEKISKIKEDTIVDESKQKMDTQSKYSDDYQSKSR